MYEEETVVDEVVEAAVEEATEEVAVETNGSEQETEGESN